MTFREADGGDKIAAFERGLTDELAHLAFETSGVTSYVVDEQFLVAYEVDEPVLIVRLVQRLYSGDTVLEIAVDKFLREEVSRLDVGGVRWP